MSPEEQARLLQDMKDQFIRSVADRLTLKAKVERAGASVNGDGAGSPVNGMPTMGEYLLDVSRIGVSFYQSLLDLNAAYWEKIAAALPDSGERAAPGKERKRPCIKRKAVVSLRDESVS